ncbi:phosphohydrolase [Bacillus coahuilensis m2-6]|uniref:bis(5'-nucleosyl)-tetraphosphatase (symmetrical) YqeK n=1 Tax=Bacillus coahuilensis TaxID=408580 RepID=UPI0001850815|nr:bis(5'-nucleosyl)-tetraphosphatase (symmetrical) YqeK [Bacillus coahuilensis]KUP07261.1 phosphohydrolase [Bacillus coahuilensis m2-6]
MNRQRALDIVKEQLTEKRYIHTLGVMETSILLASHYGVDEKQAELAAIFHDYAKFRPLEEMKEIIQDQLEDKKLLKYNQELWHAPVGAYLVEKEVGIHDSTVLDAIRYHTSGRKNMTPLEKVIYVADYIEPNRNFPGVEDARAMAYDGLDKVLLVSLKNTMQFLLNKNQLIYPDTLKAYNSIIKSIK